MSTTFKTCLFGGFDKDDVVSYIEKTAQENRERIQELAASNNALNSENEAMRRELEELRQSAADALSLTEKYNELLERSEELTKQAEELTKRTETLEAENGELRSQAAEYQSLKDHIAEIEISAHRRTQEFRAAAIAKLHDTVAQQRSWFDRKRTEYAELHENVRSQIQAAQEALGHMDEDGFEAMSAELDELDRKLDE